MAYLDVLLLGAVRGLVAPPGFTKAGLRLSDDDTLEADAVIWFKGFADKNVRSTVDGIMGLTEHSDDQKILDRKTIATCLDATWAPGV